MRGCQSYVEITRMIKDPDKMSQPELRGEVKTLRPRLEALQKVATAAKTLIDGCSFAGTIRPTENTHRLIDALAELEDQLRKLQ